MDREIWIWKAPMSGCESSGWPRWSVVMPLTTVPALRSSAVLMTLNVAWSSRFSKFASSGTRRRVSRRRELWRLVPRTHDAIPSDAASKLEVIGRPADGINYGQHLWGSVLGGGKPAAT
jgi:hypothetical protein